jgi:SAM-dependent methyltransferase
MTESSATRAASEPAPSSQPAQTVTPAAPILPAAQVAQAASPSRKSENRSGGESADKFVRRLIDIASAPYRRAGRFAWHFARGKLGGDPAFAALLSQGLLTGRARVLDIGCGQGLLSAWLLAAQACGDSASFAQAPGSAPAWPAGWPAAPRPASIHGIELMVRDVARAQAALCGPQASALAAQTDLRFTAGDMCRTDFGRADAVVILDVLHYVDIPAQDAVLRRVREALAPDGVLVMRIGDAAAGLPFWCSVAVDHAVTLVRGHGWSPMHCRTLAQWRAALGALGFRVRAMDMHAGTPFANVMLVATLGENAMDAVP